MANPVDSYFPKGGHSATQTELKYNEQTQDVQACANVAPLHHTLI